MLDFHLSGVKWNSNAGIQFREPQRMKDYTRHGHNEAVLENGIYDEKTNKVRELEEDFIVYVKEGLNDDVEQDDKWRMTLKAAAQKEKRVKIICRERFAISETKKIEHLKQQLFGNEEREEGVTDEQLIERIIVTFENNKVGMRYASDILQEKYFTDEQRNNLLGEIERYILSYTELDWEKYKKLSASLLGTYIEERSKSQTNAGIELYDAVGNSEFFKNACDRWGKGFFENRKKYGKEVPYKISISDDAKKKLIFFMREINKLHFYDNNKLHSIEHIEKVMLFSYILMGLDLKGRDLLLITAAFHDSGRAGKDGNEKHAELSAKQIEKYYLETPNNPFGITKGNLGVLQVAIHYHEYLENERGKVNVGKIKELCTKYGVRDEDIEGTIRICTLLKDADALDRARFAKRGRIDKSYLRSEIAKKDEVIQYAIDVNNRLAREILINVYGMHDDEITAGEEVNMLRNVRIEKQKEGEYTEPHLPLNKRLEIYGITEIQKDIDKKNKLLGIYRRLGIRREEVEQMQIPDSVKQLDESEQSS